MSSHRDRINKILALAFQQNWEDESFSVQKAYVCAELSALTYEDVQEYELKKASRIHLFASKAYRENIKSGVPNNFLSSLVGSDYEARFFVVRGRFAVVLGTVIRDTVILAIRGTVFVRLWDWKANLDARKFNIYNLAYFYHHASIGCGLEGTFFHTGFFEAIVPQLEAIAREILSQRAGKNKTTIVWAGHSLGGAMAAIGHAVSREMSRCGGRGDLPGRSVGAYTFGMPRYGSLGAICSFEVPHHIYKPRDIVPTVPLRRMGFADCPQEYEITDCGLVVPTERTDSFGLAGHIPKLWSSLKAHAIEGYVNSLAKAAGCSRIHD